MYNSMNFMNLDSHVTNTIMKDIEQFHHPPKFPVPLIVDVPSPGPGQH